MKIYESATRTDNSRFDELTSHFNYAPAEVLRQYVRSLDLDNEMDVLRALTKQAKQKDEVDNRVLAWEREDVRPSHTRLIVRINNHTGHGFATGENNLSLKESEQRFIDIRPWDFVTFKFDFLYTRKLGSRSKDIYKHFIWFGDQHLAFRFDFGLRVNTTFGFISSNLTPVRTHKVTALGAPPIHCLNRITHAQHEEPYGFTVELTLS